jgi:hypothetical protein
VQVRKLKIPFRRFAAWRFPTNATPDEVDSFVTSTDVVPAAGISLWEPANNPTPEYDTRPVLRTSPVVGTTSAALAVTKNAYFEFTVTAVSGLFLPRLLAFKIGRGGASAPRGYAVRSSFDSYAADLAQADTGTVRPTWTAVGVSLDMTAVASLGFRIYIYAPSASTSQEIDDLTFCGIPVL